MLTAFNPHTSGSGITWTGLAVIAAWGIGALLLSTRFFRWTPHQAEEGAGTSVEGATHHEWRAGNRAAYSMIGRA
jgi:hypothetical protein